MRGRGSFLGDERARAAVIEAHLYTRLAAERLALNPIQELTREAKRFPEEGAHTRRTSRAHNIRNLLHKGDPE